jgi:sortase B
MSAGVCGWLVYSDYARSITANAATDEVHELRPTVETDEGTPSTLLLMDFSGLLEEYPKMIAWLTIPETMIDYPVMQATDNDYYLYRDAQDNYNGNGALFLDYRNHADFSDFINFIHGHHMESGRMFQNLIYFKEKGFFGSHRTGALYTPTDSWTLEFFASVVMPHDSELYDYTLFSPADKEAYLEMVKKNATQYRDIGVTASDRLVVLSTCSYEYSDARTVVLARLAK